MVRTLTTIAIAVYIFWPGDICISDYKAYKEPIYPYVAMMTDKYIYFIDEPKGKVRKEEIIHHGEERTKGLLSIISRQNRLRR